MRKLFLTIILAVATAVTACEVETGGEEAEVIGVAPEFDIARDIYNG